MIWNHVPGHHGIEGNEAPDKLARERIDGESLPIVTTCNDISNTTEPTQVIIDEPSLLTDSEGSDNENMIYMDTLEKDLQKSFAQFEKSVERKGLDSSIVNSDSLYWDHEGLDARDYPVCTHVSEGEEDEEL